MGSKGRAPQLAHVRFLAQSGHERLRIAAAQTCLKPAELRRLFFVRSGEGRRHLGHKPRHLIFDLLVWF